MFIFIFTLFIIRFLSAPFHAAKEFEIDKFIVLKDEKISYLIKNVAILPNQTTPLTVVCLLVPRIIG